MTDSLQHLMGSQEELQIQAYNNSPRSLDTPAKIEFLKTNVLALTDELHELLGEVGWKPWATSRHINTAAAQSEAIDALHFLLNIFITLDMDAVDVITQYDAKHAKNRARQKAGYDGVSTKCPGCKRAIDDTGVNCEAADEDGEWWCSDRQDYFKADGRLVDYNG